MHARKRLLGVVGATREALAGQDRVAVVLGVDFGVQGTGEHGTFSRPQLDAIVDSAHRGITTLFDIQRKALGW